MQIQGNMVIANGATDRTVACLLHAYLSTRRIYDMGPMTAVRHGDSILVQGEFIISYFGDHKIEYSFLTGSFWHLVDKGPTKLDLDEREEFKDILLVHLDDFLM